MKLSSVVFLLILILGFGIYSNTFDCGFHFDDRPSIIDNPGIKSLSNFIGPYFRIRQFITRVTFLINYQFGKLEVVGYHLFNILIHILASILIYILVKLIFKTPNVKDSNLSRYKDFIALFSSLIFLAHPIQTQAVTYIVQRASCLAAISYVLTIILYIKARLDNRRLFYYLAILTALLSTLTKEIVITLPIILVLFEITFFGISRNTFKKRLLYFIPFFLPFIIIPLLLLADAKNISTITRETLAISRSEYLLTQFNVIRTYIRLLFLPIRQNLDYYYPLSKSLFEAKTLLSLLLHIAILLFAIKIFKKQKLISFSIFFFYIALSVESSIIPISDVIFEHRLYLPMVGFSIFIVPALFLIIKDIKKLIPLLTIVVIALSILTYTRNKVWKNDFTLWSDAVRKSPQKARPHNNIGVEYRKRGLFDKAMEEFKKAIELDPYYAEAHNNMGVEYREKGMLNQAMIELRKALNIDPEYVDSHYNLGIIYGKKSMIDTAIFHFKKALSLTPHAKAHSNLGVMYGRKGMLDASILEFKKAIKIDPDYVEAYRNLGLGYAYKNNKINALKQADMLKKLGRDDLAEIILNKLKN